MTRRRAARRPRRPRGSWTVRLRDRITGLVPAGPGAARPAAGVRRVLDLRLRRAHPRRPRGRARLRRGCSPSAASAWWHTSSLGHFVNSLHLWSVELFFAVMVIHLWGKFWMAAWRGKRALTWVTGVVAFVASIGTAFTGYLSQSNFDSQWISAEAKDGINSIGVGAWFNVLNPGQMLLWHIVLLPLVVGAHRRAARRAGPPPRRRAAARRASRGRRPTASTDMATVTHAAAAATAPRTRTTSRPGPTTWSRSS